jgi:hypothetical protein
VRSPGLLVYTSELHWYTGPGGGLAAASVEGQITIDEKRPTPSVARVAGYEVIMKVTFILDDA